MTLYSSIYPYAKVSKRPVIIAICGKSATGKDTLAAWLLSMLKAINIPANIIVSDTTRPPRLSEEDGINYNFISDTEFHNRINLEQYLEYSNFNGWFYGTNKNAIQQNSVNIGIFNVDGISSIAAHATDFEIVCIYLKCSLYRRLKRSIDREGKFKLEYLRRAKSDHFDFKNIQHILQRFPDRFVWNSYTTPITTIVDHVTWRLKMKNLLPPYNKSQ
jgi:guanylate kinase